VTIEADPLRIRQVIDNLLANVRVHTPPGTSTAVTVASDGGRATVTVADDGPGLSQADAARIFERFFRADPSRSRQHGGAGLGLSIVDAIVHAHAGTVEVSSEQGGGARFSVSLPVQGPQAAPPAQAL
jgi:two-component system OmpR family sensor kinase